MGYSIAPISANCYPGTTILINQFDMDTDLLMIATIQSAQGVTNLLKDIFTESILS